MCHHRRMATDTLEMQQARARLDALSIRFRKAEAALEAIREELNAEIVSTLKAQTLGPSDVTRHVPYERQHVGRIAKAGGVPPLREATVVSAKKKAGATG